MPRDEQETEIVRLDLTRAEYDALNDMVAITLGIMTEPLVAKLALRALLQKGEAVESLTGKLNTINLKE